MDKKCPDCGHEYNPELIKELHGGCPKCMANLLRDETELLDPKELDKPSPFVGEPFKPGDTYSGMEIVKLLGRGGMGYVYKARQPKLDRMVALKVLDPRLAVSDEFADRFNREAKALAALNHPNIVQVYDYGHEGDYHFLVMEFIDGACLREILLTSRIDPKTALRYVPQMCDALEYAHGEGVIHRDIKPENILIDQRGNLKIADFGLAKMAASERDEQQITMTGQIMGTPNYMAPEQRKSMTVDHRADIYSLGVVFYEMLTGELPLGQFPVPSKSVAVDVRLDDVVLKALEQDPKRRYQRASHVKADINETCTSGAAPAQQPRPAAGNQEKGSLSDDEQVAFADALDLVWAGYMISVVGLFVPFIDLALCSIIGSGVLAFTLLRLPRHQRELRLAGGLSIANIVLLLVMSGGAFLGLLLPLIGIVNLPVAIIQIICGILIHWHILGASGRTLTAIGRDDVSQRLYSARVGLIVYSIVITVLALIVEGIIGVALGSKAGRGELAVAGLIAQILLLPVGWFFGWFFTLRPLSMARKALRSGTERKEAPSARPFEEGRPAPAAAAPAAESRSGMSGLQKAGSVLSLLFLLGLLPLIFAGAGFNLYVLPRYIKIAKDIDLAVPSATIWAIDVLQGGWLAILAGAAAVIMLLKEVLLWRRPGSRLVLNMLSLFLTVAIITGLGFCLHPIFKRQVIYTSRHHRPGQSASTGEWTVQNLEGGILVEEQRDGHWHYYLVSQPGWGGQQEKRSLGSEPRREVESCNLTEVGLVLFMSGDPVNPVWVMTRPPAGKIFIHAMDESGRGTGSMRRKDPESRKRFENCRTVEDVLAMTLPDTPDPETPESTPDPETPESE